MNDGISVVVCCYNSAERLKDTLKCFGEQKVHPGLKWEVIIVDNCSTDNTVPIARRELEKLGRVDFKIVTENRPGLSYAREKGFNESAYPIIVLCDDDNQLAPDYINQCYEIFSNYPELGIIGGNNSYPGEIDNFVTRNYIHDYAIGKQSEEEIKDITDECGFVWGAGMALKRDVIKRLEQINFISLLSDRKGKNLSSGGDTELCFAARLLGYRIAATNLLNLKHNVPDARFKLDYLTKLKTGFGKASPYLSLYDEAWRHKFQNGQKYEYKKDLLDTVRSIFYHKQALFLYLTAQKKERKDFVELYFYLGKMKTLLKKREKLNKFYNNIVVQFNDLP